MLLIMCEKESDTGCLLRSTVLYSIKLVQVHVSMTEV